MTWQEIRKILIKARTEQHMSMTALARTTKTSPGYIHDIEAGRTTPSFDMICRIARALNVKFYVGNELLGIEKAANE